MAQVDVTIRLPDGREADLRVDDSLSSEQIQMQAMQMWDAGQFGKPEFGLFDQAIGVGEAGLTLGSGALGTIAGGWAGLGAAALPLGVSGGETVRNVQEAMTYQPRTASGRYELQKAANILEPITSAMESARKTFGDFGYSLGGQEDNPKLSATLGAAGATIPDAVLQALGLAAFKMTKGKMPMFDYSGQPTKDLRKALNEFGLTWEGLTPEAKAVIPELANQRTFSAQADVAGTVTPAVIQQMKTGGREAGLAPKMPSTDWLGNEAISPDPVAMSAIKQWRGDEGLIQMVKTSNNATRSDMFKMLEMSRRGRSDQSFANFNRPSDIAGNAFIDRIKFIRDKASTARLALDEIANNDLAGVKMDAAPVINAFNEALNNLDVVQLKVEGRAAPILDFSDSIISQDKSSQNALNSLLMLMKQGGAPDALRFHKMKRQLDALIDFQKKSSEGLTESGRNVLKTIRYTLNDQLRQANPKYAEVNDIMSQSLDLFDFINSNTAGKVNIFDKNADKMLGTELRKLFSNYNTRVNLAEGVKQADDLAKLFGGNFNNDVTSLASFATSLDRQFGPVAKNSFMGEIQGALDSAMYNRSLTGAATDIGVGVLKEKLNDIRNINDFEAYESMRKLLLRGQE